MLIRVFALRAYFVAAGFSATYQGERHTHDYWHKYEVEGGDLQQTAILIRVGVDFFILDRGLKTFATLALKSGRLKRKRDSFS